MSDTAASPSPALGSHPEERLRRIAQLRGICVVCLLSLIVLGVVWELRLAPLKGGSGALAWKALPLTLALAGLLKHKLYTYRWLSLLIWLYFTEGVVRATSDQGTSQQLAMIEIVISVVLFAACATYVRLRLKVLPRKDKSKARNDHEA